ncbi:hypothetical protein [Parendozoicomonas sp. Alg238-R29]|uniref:hypothetical protein n=1 Tax=Parendozoicomonas sp. Alg238-R29 TaxID=2993446 RepID=UPI00248E68E8|nr:hypothetical protein [Parendozoicomonas sp. Alg238-R29]
MQGRARTDLYVRNLNGDRFLITPNAFSHGYDRIPLGDKGRASRFIFDLDSQSKRQLEAVEFTPSLGARPSLASSRFNSRDALATRLSTGGLYVYTVDPGAEQRRQQVEATYTAIRNQLNQIIAAERAEAAAIEQTHQQRTELQKTGAHLVRFGSGAYEAGKSLLVWINDVHDVISLQKHLHRISKTAIKTVRTSTFEDWGVTFYTDWKEGEYRELVEALGFDPTQISVEMFSEAWDLANFLWEDERSQTLITQFAKDYARAQHSLEIAELAGTAAFEVLLTILLAAATGGAGAVASLGSKARLMEKLGKAGKLFESVADLKRKGRKPVRPKNTSSQAGPGLSGLNQDEAAGKPHEVSSKPPASIKEEAYKAKRSADNTADATVPPDVPMTQEEYDRIINLERGNRPTDVTEYLDKEYVDAHLQKFENEGGAFIVVEDWIISDNPDRQSFQEAGKFVGLSSEMDVVIAKYKAAGNDWRVLRDELNLGETTNLENVRIAYVKIPPRDPEFSYEMPTGNEYGAYEHEWVPGGFTKSGTREATLTGGDKIVHNGNVDNIINMFSNSSELLQ